MIGNGVIIQLRVVAGRDRFSFASNSDKICKIHQIGKVEIGANTTLLTELLLTLQRIGSRTKIDNLGQIDRTQCSDW